MPEFQPWPRAVPFIIHRKPSSPNGPPSFCTPRAAKGVYRLPGMCSLLRCGHAVKLPAHIYTTWHCFLRLPHASPGAARPSCYPWTVSRHLPIRALAYLSLNTFADLFSRVSQPSSSRPFLSPAGQVLLRCFDPRRLLASCCASHTSTTRGNRPTPPRQRVRNPADREYILVSGASS